MRNSYQTLLPAKEKKIKAGFFSHLFFAWMNDLLSLGYTRPLSDEDLLQLSNENKAHDLVEELYDLWNDEVRNSKNDNKKPRLWKAMTKMFPAQDYAQLFVLHLTEESMKFVLAVLIWMFLKLLEGASHMDTRYAVAVVTGIGIASVVKAFCYHHFDFQSFTMGMRLKIAVIGIVHKKVQSANSTKVKESQEMNTKQIEDERKGSKLSQINTFFSLVDQ